MNIDNPFDEKLKIWGDRIPNEIRDASVFVTDTMELCRASAESIFEEKATPEIAIAIYDRINQRISEQQNDN